MDESTAICDSIVRAPRYAGNSTEDPDPLQTSNFDRAIRQEASSDKKAPEPDRIRASETAAEQPFQKRSPTQRCTTSSQNDEPTSASPTKARPDNDASSQSAVDVKQRLKNVIHEFLHTYVSESAKSETDTDIYSAVLNVLDDEVGTLPSAFTEPMKRVAAILERLPAKINAYDMDAISIELRESLLPKAETILDVLLKAQGIPPSQGGLPLLRSANPATMTILNFNTAREHHKKLQATSQKLLQNIMSGEHSNSRWVKTAEKSRKTAFVGMVFKTNEVYYEGEGTDVETDDDAVVFSLFGQFRVKYRRLGCRRVAHRGCWREPIYTNDRQTISQMKEKGVHSCRSIVGPRAELAVDADNQDPPIETTGWSPALNAKIDYDVDKFIPHGTCQPWMKEGGLTVRGKKVFLLDVNSYAISDVNEVDQTLSLPTIGEEQQDQLKRISWRIEDLEDDLPACKAEIEELRAIVLRDRDEARWGDRRPRQRRQLQVHIFASDPERAVVIETIVRGRHAVTFTIPVTTLVVGGIVTVTTEWTEYRNRESRCRAAWTKCTVECCTFDSSKACAMMRRLMGKR